jgi:ketosteroid isomerase-like protein
VRGNAFPGQIVRESTEPQVTESENKQIVQSFYDAGNRGDMETCFDLIADDIVWRNIGTTSFSGTFRGKAELQQKLLGPLFGRLKSGISMKVQRLIAEGDCVVAQSSGTAETVDGRSYDNTYCWIIRLRDGLFAEVTEFADTELITSTFG